MSAPGEGRKTPLFDAHVAAGARMVPFAGYQMPVQFAGILAEHTATRTSAGLFDVSHMGQILLTEAEGGAAAVWLERLTPSDIKGLGEGRARYTVFTNDDGGVIDDLIVTRVPGGYRLVVNGARKDHVAAHLSAHADPHVTVTHLDRALIALQGPLAEAVLSPHVDAALTDLTFMTAMKAKAFGGEALVSRCGYTGEDGFEVSLDNARVVDAWNTLTADARVSPVGLGARDTLRLESGLCLYGQDLDQTISPIEAGLQWVVAKRRRADGGFLGAERILKELAEGPARKRVGLSVEGRVPARAGATLMDGEAEVGIVTSGGFAPTVGAPIAMGYVAPDKAAPGTPLDALVRGKRLPAVVTALPFVPQNTKRKGLT